MNEIKLKIYSKNFSQSYDENNALFTKGYHFGELKKEAVDSIIKISKKYLNTFSENIKKIKQIEMIYLLILALILEKLSKL